MADATTPAFDPQRDFHLGDASCEEAIVFYGDYTSETCRRLRDILRRIAERLEGRVVYVYRQYPPAVGDAERAARAAIAAGWQGKFWEMHRQLFARGQSFTEGSIAALAEEIRLDTERFARDLHSDATEAHLAEDRRSAQAAGVRLTPSLFIGGELYLGAWDELAILEAVERPLGVRVERARQRFFGWAASGGLVLVMATLAALLVANLGLHDVYERLRGTPFALAFGEARFALPLEVWINDGLMAIFFLIVGIEIKREIVAGELADVSSAMLPVAGAIGGMAVPGLIYAAINWGGPAAQGWGVPMATDIAFTLGLMALLGQRVPNALKVFVSALAIADDLGAILVIALFYGHGFHLPAFLGALACLGLMAMLNRGRVYALYPYIILGVVLWAFVHASGLHATLAGVLTAVLIPSRRAANVEGVAAQTRTIFATVEQYAAAGATRIGERAVAVMETAIARLREPGEHLQRALENWTNYLILPAFAFFNTGVLVIGSSFSPLAPESLGVILGLVVGKPLGITGACYLAVRARWAQLSAEISWWQVLGAGCLAGVGFTMSIFIATAAFQGAQLEAVKLSVLLASTTSAMLGMVILSQASKTPQRSVEAA